MLIEVEDAVNALRLNVTVPIIPTQLRTVYVCRPLLSGVGGVIETTNYSFGFKRGRLKSITKIDKKAIEGAYREEFLSIMKMRSLVDTNSAHDVAIDWLRKISVDVDALERRYKCRVEQRFCYPGLQGEQGGDHRALLPIFDVIWGDSRQPAVMVAIFGPLKSLLVLRVNDDAFLRRSELKVDIDGLFGVPDRQFAVMSSLERRKLVERFQVKENPKELIKENEK